MKSRLLVYGIAAFVVWLTLFLYFLIAKPCLKKPSNAADRFENWKEPLTLAAIVTVPWNLVITVGNRKQAKAKGIGYGSRFLHTIIMYVVAFVVFYFLTVIDAPLICAEDFNSAMQSSSALFVLFAFLIVIPFVIFRHMHLTYMYGSSQSKPTKTGIELQRISPTPSTNRASSPSSLYVRPMGMNSLDLLV